MDIRYTVGVSDARGFVESARTNFAAGKTNDAMDDIEKAEAALDDADKQVDEHSPREMLGELLILRGEFEALRARVKA